jgi:hypothetical protein
MHVTINAVMMAVFAFVHLCSIGSVAINLVAFYGGPDIFHTGAGRHANDVERTAAFATYMVALLWAVAGLGWAPINAYGLFAKKRWARTSSLVYWAVQIASCCCLPFGAYGLYAMLRRDVKTLLG